MNSAFSLAFLLLLSGCAAHAEWFGYQEKRNRAKTIGAPAWVNPEEYRQFVAKQKRAFEDQVDLEMGAKK